MYLLGFIFFVWSWLSFQVDSSKQLQFFFHSHFIFLKQTFFWILQLDAAPSFSYVSFHVCPYAGLFLYAVSALQLFGDRFGYFSFLCLGDLISHGLVRYCQFHENRNETNKDMNHHQIKSSKTKNAGRQTAGLKFCCVARKKRNVARQFQNPILSLSCVVVFLVAHPGCAYIWC